MRKKLYIDPEIQFPLIGTLILLVTIEGFFVGWGFYKAITIARDWGRPHQVVDFFIVLACTIVPIVFINFFVGTFLTNKIAGPLLRFREVIAEIIRGNLEREVTIRTGDLLQSHAVQFNQMVQTLRRLIYRDYQYAAEALAIVTRAHEWIDKRSGLKPAEKQELGKLFNDARSRLSIINVHFTKGRSEL